MNMQDCLSVCLYVYNVFIVTNRNCWLASSGIEQVILRINEYCDNNDLLPLNIRIGRSKTCNHPPCKFENVRICAIVAYQWNHQYYSAVFISLVGVIIIARCFTNQRVAAVIIAARVTLTVYACMSNSSRFVHDYQRFVNVEDIT
jgi:hypothetical protein